MFHMVKFHNVLVSEDEVTLCKLTERCGHAHTTPHTQTANTKLHIDAQESHKIEEE